MLFRLYVITEGARAIQWNGDWGLGRGNEMSLEVSKGVERRCVLRFFLVGFCASNLTLVLLLIS